MRPVRDPPLALGGDRVVMRERGWLGPDLDDGANSAPNGWLATTANAYEVSARIEIDAARSLVLDRPYRHKRKAVHLARARQAALHVSALRELLRIRQRQT